MSVETLKSLLAVAIGLTLAGCGQSAIGVPLAGQTAMTDLTAAHHHGSPNPKPSVNPGPGPNPAPSVGPQGLTFVTIEASVVQLLPDSHNPNNNLDHQNFIVKTPAGETLYVNNDITAGIGTRVQGLTTGEQLEIRGVEYHDTDRDGIHWTHHDRVSNDAGFIKTPDGTVYQ